ncbi:MAG TPA: DUF2071 domain-containing protein [Candidatus Methylacidiphilales bacterium]|nr:DUF2071 domain-containing protein [Candidatus Methylacidiphilales bacterium]
MLRLPTIEGIIRRRLLVNFRADPQVIARLLPSGFRPKLHRGYAIVGICLIRLEEVRPLGFPRALGMYSENAAHRIAVEWDADADCTAATAVTIETNTAPRIRREGVYIPRRDTGSILNALAGGRVFPGEQYHSRFAVEDDGTTIRFSMQSHELCDYQDSRHAENSRAGESVAIHLEAHTAASLPDTSVFRSLEEASAYFEGGCIGYSATCDTIRLDGIELRTARWEVQPLQVSRVHSSYFRDEKRFPPGTIEFDHALIMRNIPHEWHSIPDYGAA